MKAHNKGPIRPRESLCHSLCDPRQRQQGHPGSMIVVCLQNGGTELGLDSGLPSDSKYRKKEYVD